MHNHVFARASKQSYAHLVYAIHFQIVVAKSLGADCVLNFVSLIFFSAIAAAQTAIPPGGIRSSSVRELNSRFLDSAERFALRISCFARNDKSSGCIRPLFVRQRAWRIPTSSGSLPCRCYLSEE